jgi:uncharacterized protein
VERPRRPVAVPELFLGLVAIGVAVVLTAHIFSGTIKDVRHTRDTLSVTGSARVPISANLVRWYVSVSPRARTPVVAARRLRQEVVSVRAFLRHAGIPADAISADVVTTETQVIPLSKKRRRTLYVVSQRLEVDTHQIDVVEAASTRLGNLIERGIAVSAGPLQYISTELTKAKLAALEKATDEARRRAEILVHGLGGKLGRMRSSSLGVYQVTPRFSTDVTDYGVNDVSSRDKDVNAVVSATFDVKD